MKTNQMRNLGMLLLLALPGLPILAPAADRYHISISLSGKTTNGTLALVSHPLNRSVVLKNISDGTGIPVSKLALILERESGMVRVVDREFGTNVTSLLWLETDLSVSNTNLTKGEVFMKVHHATQDNFDGSAVATVSIKRNASQEETGFKITGKIHVAVEATDEDRTEIYSGVFSTGVPFEPKQAIP